MFKGFSTMLVLGLLLLTSLFVHAQDDQSGFISIDCGIAKGTTYSDQVTDIHYVSDVDFIDSGEIHNIWPIHEAPNIQLTTLTSFPENTKNCYTLKPAQGKGNKYLIRAQFMYGDYDSNRRFPEFDVYLGPDYWDTITFNVSSTPVSKEIIHVSSSDYIHVCLVNTGRGTPFISAIELRLLEGDMYDKTKFGSLNLFHRINFGTTSRSIVRYKADKYDRIWRSISWPDYTVLQTSDEVYSEPSKKIDLPSEVMRSAMSSKYQKDTFDITWDPHNTTDNFIIYIHLAEIEILKENKTREFNISLNGNHFYGPFSPINHTSFTIFNSSPRVAPTFILTFSKTRRSTLPPIINALELYTIKQLQQRQTNDRDAAAMWSIKSTYRVAKHWQGDPCVPQEFVWDGVECSYNDTESPKIVLLNLSTSGLNGAIDPELANLTMIHTLDLSNNNLTGYIPNFLSGLKNLKILYLKGNNFTGPVPASLSEKANKGLLSLSLSEESTSDSTSLCCKKRKNNKIIGLVIAPVALLFVILTIITTKRMIKNSKEDGKRKICMGLEIREQQYTYSEIQTITDNFSVLLGKGGFGKVYHGYIGDTEVAVKMLSESSLQGEKEFQAEAYLLLCVHHKNLTSLVGYCHEGNHKGIIYEYMANGNLKRHLFGIRRD